MSTTNVVWTPELKYELAKYWVRGESVAEIAASMGIPFEKVQSAIKRARKGQWGDDAKRIFGEPRPKQEDKLQADNAEAKKRGLSYGQLQAERLKSKTRIAWSLEMKNELRRLHEQGMSVSEIAERMGVDETKVAAQLKHMKYRPAVSFNVKQCDDTADTPESEQCEEPEPIVEIEEPAAVSADEVPEEPKLTAADPVDKSADENAAEPINMIDAVDILIACAKLFGMDELIETRGSKFHDKAAITFERGTQTYVIEIFGTE